MKNFLIKFKFKNILNMNLSRIINRINKEVASLKKFNCNLMKYQEQNLILREVRLIKYLISGKTSIRSVQINLIVC